MSVKKSIILSIAIVVAAVVAVTGFGVHRAWHSFSVEDQIHATYFPVAMALFDYQHDHGSPATNLAQLIPVYIRQIPSSRLADSVDYSIINGGKAWQLNIQSRALSTPRLYCCRSSQQFTAEEAQRIVLKYHGIWTVLRE